MGEGGIQKVIFFMHFQTLTGHDPYPYQIETYEAFAKISSPLPLWPWLVEERARACPELVEGVRGNSLRAPTGSGKSEVI
jgi:hypothetical protein